MQPKNRRAALGVLLVVIGAVILLKNADILPDSLWWIARWYTLILAVGIFNLFTGNRTAGIILSLVGALFLLDGLGIFDFDWMYVWPVIIIIIGLAFIFRQRIQTTELVKGDGDFLTLSAFSAAASSRFRERVCEAEG
jgi:predicted membrane protein